MDSCKRPKSAAELLYMAFKLIIRNAWFRFVLGLCMICFSFYIGAWAIKQNAAFSELLNIFK